MQLRQGNLAMVGNLHQRMGDDGTAGAPAGDAAAGMARRSWGRLLGVDVDVAQAGTVAPRSEGRLKGLQVGTDLYAAPGWQAGLYVGQLEGDVRVRGFARGLRDLAVGGSNLRSQYLGGYLTYTHVSGFYADAVLQVARHRYSLAPLGNLPVAGKGSSRLASIELGQAFALAERWKIEPQLQLVHEDQRLDDVRIGGALVQQRPARGLLARAGVRIRGELSTGLGPLQPYARLNLYRAGGGTDTVRFRSPAAATDIVSSGRGRWGEVAAGMTLELAPSVSLYGEAGRLFHLGGDARVRSGLQGSVGVRMRW